MPRRLWAVVVMAAMPALPACNNGPSAPSNPSVTSVAVQGIAPQVSATAPFTATAALSNGTTRDVTAQATWSSSNPSVASVGSTGNVAGVSAGEADIVATYQGVTGRSHVTITRAAVSTYTISGTVTDGTSGGILPNINISATDAGGNTRSTLTASSGTYTLTGLIAGQVTITASAISYQTTVVTVTLTGDAHVDIVLPRVVCTFTLSPTSLSFPSSGGTGTVTVTSHAVGCAWTAKANDAFLAIVSGGAGNDNGTACFLWRPTPARRERER
jgi:hypothetical protein